MTQRAALPAEIARPAIALSRALIVALRAWSFYPPDHPGVALAVDRLGAAAYDAAASGPLQLAITPHTLLVDGVVLESPDLAVAECAALLHDRDLLQLALLSPPTDAALRALLAVLSLDRETRRARGGPAAIWRAEGDRSVLLEQIDYQSILERVADESGPRRDATWTAIVRSIVTGRSSFTLEEQQRLLEISHDVGAIGDLARDCCAPFTTPDGSPMQTTQAAAILAVYRHLAQSVAVLDPARADALMNTLGLAASALEPGLAFELLTRGAADAPAAAEGAVPDGQALAGSLRRSLDDRQVATLLARAIAAPGQAAGRLSQVLETVTPDHERRLRVLRLAQKMTTERDFGVRRPMEQIRQSFDELLLKYDERTFVSPGYRGAMDQGAGHVAEVLARILPPEMDEWLETLGHDSVRRLSGVLLMDLLRNETVARRAAELAGDMSAFVEDLLMAGAFDEAPPVIEALKAEETRQPPLAPAECRAAIDRLGGSAAFAEAVAALEEHTPEEAAALGRVAAAIGPATVTTLLGAYKQEDIGTGGERATAMLGALDPSAIAPLAAAAAGETPWYVQREIARALGQIGTAAAVPPLQALVRLPELRVVHAGVLALARINDPSAARALQTLLKATSGQARATVISALVGIRDPRVVPMLSRILGESDPFGAEHAMVLETMSALGALRDDRAVAAVAAMARRRHWWKWLRTRATRRAALRTLERIGSEPARQALAGLAPARGHFLRRLTRLVSRRAA